MTVWFQVWWILLHGLFSQAVYPFPGPRVLVTPPPLSGLLVWTEADVGNNCGGGACTDGASQDSWADQSGNGNNLALVNGVSSNCVASVYHTNQINGKPAVTLNGNTSAGSETCFALNGSLDNKATTTFFGVFKARVTSPAGTYSGGGGGATTWNQNGNQQVLQHGSIDGIGTSISAPDTSWHAMIATYNSSSGAYQFFTDLVPDGSGTQARTIGGNWIAIGVTFAGGTIGTWDGQVAEFGMYNRVLSGDSTSGEIYTVGNYLYNKYALGHPAHWLISKVADSGGSSVNTLTTAAMNLSAGNLLVMGIRGGSSSLTVSSISDTAGNTFTQCPSAISNTSNMTDIWYAKNTIANAANQVTVNYSGSATFQGVIASQFVGLNTSSPQDTSANGHATGTSVTSGSFTPAGAGEVAFVVASPSSGAAWTAGTGYGLQTNSGTSNVQTETGYIGTGSQTASISIVGSNNLDLSVCVFKP